MQIYNILKKHVQTDFILWSYDNKIKAILKTKNRKLKKYKIVS